MSDDAQVTRLRAGIAWVVDGVPQPRGALMQHHGIYCRGADGEVSIVPQGAAGMPVVVFNLHDYEQEFTRAECTSLRKLVQRALPAGVTVRDTWNGVGCNTFSIGLSRAAAAPIRGLVTTYLAGCPDHQGSVFCNCGWFTEGRALAVLPEGWR